MDRAHGSNLKALCKDTATPYSPNTLNSRFPQECGRRNVFVNCKYRSVMFGFGGHKYIAPRLRRAVVYTLSIAVAISLVGIAWERMSLSRLRGSRTNYPLNC
jgi:hypothetical protein